MAEMRENQVNDVPLNGYRSPRVPHDQNDDDGFVYFINASVPAHEGEDAQDSLVYVINTHAD